MKHNTIGKGHKERGVNGGSDKYYTKQWIADYYSSLMYERYGDTSYIEPTAGSGVFLNVLPNIQGYDLLPEKADVIEMDVFKLLVKPTDVIIGNPPFGFQATMAVDVFNTLANQSVRAIGFILPRSFKKDSIKDKLNTNYHLVFEQDLVDDAFTVEGDSYNVPCVFQIWEWKDKERTVSPIPTTDWFTFTTKEDADIAVRRVGGRAGKLLEGVNHNSVSTYFLKIKDVKVKKAIQLINLESVDWTAGVRSMSKPELIKEVNRVMEIIK